MNLLACLGLVWILKDSYIFKKPRDFLSKQAKWIAELLSCAMCLGFWAGLTLSFFEYYFLEQTESIYYYPLASSAFCWFFDSLLDLIQELWVKHKKQRELNE